MIRKSGKRFSEKIMLHQTVDNRFNMALGIYTNIRAYFAASVNIILGFTA